MDPYDSDSSDGVPSSLRSPLRSQTYSFPTTPHFWLYLPNAEMTLDLEANEVEVKGLTSLASVTDLTVDQCSNRADAVAELCFVGKGGGPVARHVRNMFSFSYFMLHHLRLPLFLF